MKFFYHDKPIIDQIQKEIDLARISRYMQRIDHWRAILKFIMHDETILNQIQKEIDLARIKDDPPIKCVHLTPAEWNQYLKENPKVHRNTACEFYGEIKIIRGRA